MIAPNRVPCGFQANGRLQFLDFFRGCVIFMLIGEATGLYELLVVPNLKGSLIYRIGLQFQHQAWIGLNLWDLGQPFFMLISGVAMVYSYEKRWKLGESWRATLGHAINRSLLLLLLGWALYQVNPVDHGFQGAFLLDVLPQLAFANIIAFLLMKRSTLAHVGAAVGLIALTELLYRLPVPGFSQLFSPGHNFGSYIDSILFGQPSADNWAVFNIVPSVSYVLMGAVCGRILRSDRPQATKMITLGSTGMACLVLGLAISPMTPIIRRICTSSFILVSAGLGLCALCLAYLVVDVFEFRRVTKALMVVGMNSLFIYLVAMSGGTDWLRRLVQPFAMSFGVWAGQWQARVLTSILVWALLWALGYWLCRKRIFINI